MFCRPLFVLLYFLFWPLCCLFFFDIRILITPLASSNSSWPKRSCEAFLSLSIRHRTSSVHSYISIFFSETTGTIRIKLAMNVHWMVLQDRKYTKEIRFPNVSKWLFLSSFLKPLGHLEPNFVGMFIGWLSNELMFFCCCWWDGYIRNKSQKRCCMFLNLFSWKQTAHFGVKQRFTTSLTAPVNTCAYILHFSDYYYCLSHLTKKVTFCNNILTEPLYHNWFSKELIHFFVLSKYKNDK